VAVTSGNSDLSPDSNIQSNTDSSDSYPSPFRANYALTMLMLAYILSFVDRQILALLIEPMKADLHLSDLQIGLVQGLAFAVFYTILGIPIARLADNYSRRLVISVGILIWSAMTAACGLAKGFTTLFIARMGVGVGEAALSPSAFSMLSDYFPPEKLARALSIYVLGGTIGAGLAYLLGGMVLDLVEHSGPVMLPLFGELKVWQLAFILVALPGPILMLLFATVREPTRKTVPVRSAEKNTGVSGNEAIPFKEILRYLNSRRKLYGYHFATLTFLPIVGTGIMLWIPSFFIRTYGQTAINVGYHYGLIYLVFGSLGTICGGFAAQALSKRYKDGNMRWVFIVAIMHPIPYILTFLMPTYESALTMSALLTFVGSSYFGVSIAALQLVTPNRMRAQVSAMLLFFSNISGMALGPLIIALITDFIYGDEMYLNYSIATMSAIFLPIGIVMSYRAMVHYGKAIEEMGL
jgi:MFS family permease